MIDKKQEDIWSNEIYENILSEIHNYLQLYLFKDASINHDSVVDWLFKLDDYNILLLKKLHFLISNEVEDFVKILPLLIRNLSHSTSKEEIETHGNIIGQINWSQTFKQRMSTGLKDKSLFVCNTNRKLYDLPENQLLKFLLNKINKFIKDMNITYHDNLKEEVINYQEYINNIHIVTGKIIKNVHLKNVELPKHIDAKTLRKTRKSHNNLYEYVVSVYELYEKLFIINDDNVLLDLLNKQILTPNNKDTLYEVYVLFKIIEKMNRDSLRVGLLKSGNDYIIHSEFENKTVNIYYQHLPEIFKDNNIKKLRQYYDFYLPDKRPDIIVEYDKKGKKTYKIIEVKRTRDSNYIRNSVYKVFGYLKDYEKVPLEQSNILVVWDGIEIVQQKNLEKQELVVLNHDEFIRKINSYVLYEKEKVNITDYWQQLKAFHERTYSSIGDFYEDNWFAIDLDDIPYKIANIQLKINKHSIEIELYHIFFRKVYDYLYSHMDEIEDEIGDVLIWKGVNSKKYGSSITLTKNIDCYNSENWQECIEWHSDMINKFKKVFIRYLKEYDLSAYHVDAKIDTVVSQRKYWTNINNRLNADKKIKITEVQPYSWHKILINSNKAYFTLKTDYVKKRIGIELYIPQSKALFAYLENEKDKIEEELGYELTWQNINKQTFSKIMLYNNKFNPKHEELWHYCMKWHYDMLQKFNKVFLPRINEFENNI